MMYTPKQIAIAYWKSIKYTVTSISILLAFSSPFALILFLICKYTSISIVDCAPYIIISVGVFTFISMLSLAELITLKPNKFPDIDEEIAQIRKEQDLIKQEQNSLKDLQKENPHKPENL